MQIPFITDDALSQLSPNASKALLVLCSRMEERTARGRVLDAASRASMSERTFRRCLEELADAKLIERGWTCDGFDVRIPFGNRWTWIRWFGDGRIGRLSGRAAKALLILSRCVRNGTDCSVTRVKNVARLLGRSVRTATLAISELRQADLLDGMRTGRACVWSLKIDNRKFPRRTLAHRAGLALRILRSLDRHELSSLLSRCRKDGLRVVERIGDIANWRATKRYIQDRLMEVGIPSSVARKFCRRHEHEELCTLIELIRQRRPRRVIAFAVAALRGGWALSV